MAGNSMTRRFAITALTATMAFGATHAVAQPVGGNYTAEGRNPDGSTYSGQVSISERGDGVAMSWHIGSQKYSGRGFRDGRVLTVNWGDKHPVVYVVMPSGELHGTWSNGRALEKLVPW